MNIYICKTKRPHSLDLSKILYSKRVEVEQSAGNRGGVRVGFSGQAASESSTRPECTHPTLQLCPPTLAALRLSLLPHATCLALSCLASSPSDTRSLSLPTCPLSACSLESARGPSLWGKSQRKRHSGGTVRRELPRAAELPRASSCSPQMGPTSSRLTWAVRARVRRAGRRAWPCTL